MPRQLFVLQTTLVVACSKYPTVPWLLMQVNVYFTVLLAFLIAFAALQR